jgi:hypothetical protein
VPQLPPTIITDQIDTYLQQIIRDIYAERNAPIVELKTTPDHVHLLLTRDPQYGIHHLVKQIKDWSSRLLRTEIPPLPARLPTFEPTAISPPPSVAPFWRSSTTMSRNSATPDRPYLPMAKARGLSGGFR